MELPGVATTGTAAAVAVQIPQHRIADVTRVEPGQKADRAHADTRQHPNQHDAAAEEHVEAQAPHSAFVEPCQGLVIHRLGHQRHAAGKSDADSQVQEKSPLAASQAGSCTGATYPIRTDDLLRAMQEQGADFTLTFRNLGDEVEAQPESVGGIPVPWHRA